MYSIFIMNMKIYIHTYNVFCSVFNHDFQWTRQSLVSKFCQGGSVDRWVFFVVVPRCHPRLVSVPEYQLKKTGKLQGTSPKTNMEPKCVFSRCFSFLIGVFSGSILVFGGVNSERTLKSWEESPYTFEFKIKIFLMIWGNDFEIMKHPIRIYQPPCFFGSGSDWNLTMEYEGFCSNLTWLASSPAQKIYQEKTYTP